MTLVKFDCEFYVNQQNDEMLEELGVEVKKKIEIGNVVIDLECISSFNPSSGDTDAGVVVRMKDGTEFCLVISFDKFAGIVNTNVLPIYELER